MKYRLPGIYLGNISIDNLIDYIKNEDLQKAEFSLDYHKTINRTENIYLRRLIFTNLSETETYSYYTYDYFSQKDFEKYVEKYFDDIIALEDVSLANVDFAEYPSEKENILYDTLDEESVYWNYIKIFDENNDPHYYYHLKLTYESNNEEVEITDREHFINIMLDNMDNDTTIKIYDTRYFDPVLLKEITIVKDNINRESREVPFSYEHNNEELWGNLYFSYKSALNTLLNGSYVYSDRFGRLNSKPINNSIWGDIEWNRKIHSEGSLRNELIKGANGRVQIVRHYPEDNDSDFFHFTLDKYDKYNLESKYEKFYGIYDDSDGPIIKEDTDITTINKIERSIDENSVINKDSIVRYSRLFNTTNLPKIRGIKLNNSTTGIYIFNTDNIKDDFLKEEHAYLADVYSNIKIEIDSTKYTVHYEIIKNDNERHIHRYIMKDGEKIYIRLTATEDTSGGYLIIPTTINKSNTNLEDIKSNITDILKDLGLEKFEVYPFNMDSDIIINVTSKDDIEKDIKNLMLLYNKYNSHNKSYKYIPNDKIINNNFIEYPITINIEPDNGLVTLDKDVFLTLKTKEVDMYNSYNLDLKGYYSMEGDTDTIITTPNLNEFYDESFHPFYEVVNYPEFDDYDEIRNNKNEIEGLEYKHVLINKYDQRRQYKSTDTLRYADVSYDKYSDMIFKNIIFSEEVFDNTLENILNRNDVVNANNRGDLIPSNVIKRDALEELRTDIKDGFYSVFYDFNTYISKGELSTDAIRNSTTDYVKKELFTYNGLNKSIDSFLKLGNVIGNNKQYLIDSNFKIGFIVSKPNGPEAASGNAYRNWISTDEKYFNKLNALERIKQYDNFPTNKDIDQEYTIRRIVDEKSYSESRTETDTGYMIKRHDSKDKDVHNINIVVDALYMLMDPMYDVDSLLLSFNNLSIENMVELEDKRLSQIEESSNDFRYLNSKQNIKVLVQTYLDGYTKKIG